MGIFDERKFEFYSRIREFDRKVSAACSENFGRMTEG